MKNDVEGTKLWVDIIRSNTTKESFKEIKNEVERVKLESFKKMKNEVEEMKLWMDIIKGNTTKESFNKMKNEVETAILWMNIITG